MVKDNLFLAKNRKKARKMGYILLFDYEYVQNNNILNLIGIAEVCYKSIEHITTQYFSFGIELSFRYTLSTSTDVVTTPITPPMTKLSV